MQERYRGTAAKIYKDWTVSSNGEGTRALIEEILGAEFDPDYLKNYPYESPDLEGPAGETGERFTSVLLELENLQEGLGKKVWRSTKTGDRFTRLRTSHAALEMAYTGPDESMEASDEKKVLARMELALPDNGTGVRNRARKVQEEVADTINTFPGSRLNFLGVAAGSGRAMEKAIASSQRAGDINFLMVDRSKRAEVDGRILAQSLGIEESVSFQSLDVLKERNLYLPGKPHFHLIEVVGFLDYQDDETCIELLSTLGKNLIEGGKLLFANIAPNKERDFLEKVIGWEIMVYRKAEELWRMAKEAGFNNIRLIEEPVKVYNLVAAIR